jgi:hypothetical protein
MCWVRSSFSPFFPIYKCWSLNQIGQPSSSFFEPIFHSPNSSWSSEMFLSTKGNLKKIKNGCQILTIFIYCIRFLKIVSWVITIAMKSHKLKMKLVLSPKVGWIIFCMSIQTGYLLNTSKNPNEDVGGDGIWKSYSMHWIEFKFNSSCIAMLFISQLHIGMNYIFHLKSIWKFFLDPQRY